MLAMALLVSFARAGEVKLIAGETSVRVEMGDKLFTIYRFAGDEKPPFVRPFFYPVLAVDGTEVTSDQSRTNPKEHPHQRSIWVGHGSVNGLDHWSFEQKPSPPKQRHLKFNKLERDKIVEELSWENLTGGEMLHEVRTIRFLSFDDDSRGIDLTVALTATVGDVTLGDTKEAGLCAVRVARQISTKPTLINSTGAQGEKAVWGQRATWVDESGMIDGRPYGIAVFDHPSNPRYPTPWHAREYGLLAPNEFGLHVFDKQLPTGAGDFKIAKGQTAVFHYEVVIHQGDTSSAKISKKYATFSHP